MVNSAYDADRVDNLHASQFVRADVADVKSGDLSLNAGLTVGSAGDYAASGEITQSGKHYRRPASTKRNLPITWLNTITVWNGATLTAGSNYYINIQSLGVPDYQYCTAVLLRGSTGASNPQTASTYLLFYANGSSYLKASTRPQYPSHHHNDFNVIVPIGTSYQIKASVGSGQDLGAYCDIVGAIYS